MRFKRYIESAQRRARRRKSPWNVILIPLVLGTAALITYILFQIMWQIHVAIYPAHVNKLGDFWGEGIGLSPFFSSFLLFMPLLFASFPISMMIANAVIQFIPSARKVLDIEAKGTKGASFRESMSGLWRISRVVVPVCLLLSLIGAVTLINLR